jgi:glucose/arabinose dehydrogenase/azurin
MDQQNNTMNWYMRYLICLASLIMLYEVCRAQHGDHHSTNNIVPKTEEDYYKIETLPIPATVAMEVGGITELPDGRIAVVTRLGQLWIIENAYSAVAKPHFKLFATGLHEPLGLAFRDGAFYVAQREELTKISDLNGDDKADDFEVICTWPLSGNYCEYNHGPVIGPDGNFYVNLNLGDNGWWTQEPFYGEMGGTSKWRGWMVKITPDGKFAPFAGGLRSPAGIGKNSEGEIFYTENQGGWVGTGFISHVKEGDFFGHPSALKLVQNDPLNKLPVKIKDIPLNEPLFHEAVKKVPGLKLPSVRLPHGILGTSTAGFTADISNGGFGPFSGQLFVGDEGHANIARVFLEKVNGEYQGVAFPFRKGFKSGIIRLLMGRNSSIFVGMSDRGWNSVGKERYGLQRLVWTGKTPFEIKSVSARPDGFELEFTTPVNRQTSVNAKNYEISGFDYLYHTTYGSDVMDKQKCIIKAIKISDNGLKVRLKIDGLRSGYIHEIKCEGIKAESGDPLLHDVGYYSLNSIPSGDSLSLNEPGVVRINTSNVSASPQKKSTVLKKPVRAPVQGKRVSRMPSSWMNRPDKTITIGTKPGLKFDIENFTVKPGTRIKLVFSNSDDMQHNVVFVTPGSGDEVGKKALKLGLDGPKLDYVPASPSVLFHTKLLQPRTTETIYFTAPSRPAEYPYICTYPGHYLIMRGKMIVKN